MKPVVVVVGGGGGGGGGKTKWKTKQRDWRCEIGGER